jgi:uncharacterized membrane protein YbhN (UPF0104 family)
MSRNRKWLWLGLKAAAAVAIVVGVGEQFRRILSNPELEQRGFPVRGEYLVPAGLLYLLAHCCWGTFWVRLLRSEGVRVSLFIGLRAYFVSQYGKYIPGKVWVIGIRVAMLGHDRLTKLAVGVTATYETLTSMAAGAMLGVLLLPRLGVMPEFVSGNVAILAGLAGLPLGLAVINRLGARAVAKRRGPDSPALPSPSLWLLTQGLLHGAAGWCLLALSLALTVQALAPDPPAWGADVFLTDLPAVALAYVVGFVVVVAPGGIGAREFVLQAVLVPQFAGRLGAPEAQALAVTITLLLRLVWTAAEVTISLGLYLWPPAVSANSPEREGDHAGGR